MKKPFIACLFPIIFGNLTHAQSTTANNIGAAGKFIGFSNNFPLNVFTSNILRAQFTTGSPLSGLNGPGDGLHIFNSLPSGGGGNGEVPGTITRS